MTRRGLVIDDGKLRLEYLRTAADTDGDVHEMLARYAPGSPWPPAHLHPAQDERFVVQEGRLQFRLDGELRTVTSAAVRGLATAARLTKGGRTPA